MAEIGTDMMKAQALLEAGELVAIPTETVYGLAGNALDANAVARIFEAKNRPHFDPLIVHIPNAAAAAQYALPLTPQTRRLADAFWPGPLTLLLPRKPMIPDLVTAGLDTVGLRCPRHPLTLQLLKNLSFPLAAPSANPFGYVSPTTATHVNAQLGDKIAYILDGGPCTVGLESTIVGMADHAPTLYRLGGLSQETIETITGPVTVSLNTSSNPKAPGQLKSHYAPTKRIVTGSLPALLQEYKHLAIAVLSFTHNYKMPHQFVLAPTGSMAEAAQNLFTALRYLDTLPVDMILAELAPEEGLGRAINDRLRRAAAQ